MNAAARFKQSEIDRIFRAAKKAGYRRCRVGIDGAGNIVADVSDDATESMPRANPLDRLLQIE